MKKTLVAALVVFAILVTSIAVFADTAQSTSIPTNKPTFCQNFKGPGKGMGGGRHITLQVLSEKTKLTIDQIFELKKSGKTIADILKDKGIKVEDFRAAVLEAHYKIIDEKVSNKELTQEQAKQIKADLKARMENCNFDGTAKGPGYGPGNGMMRKGPGNGCHMGNPPTSAPNL